MMQRVDGGQFVSRTAATAIIASQANRLEEFRDLCLSTASDAGEAQLRVRALRALLSEAEKFLTDLRSCVNGEGPYARGSDSDTLDALYGDAGVLSDKIREATK
jgi:hypothetical protein